MPTPVTTARQCLTPESSQTLEAAVSVARLRVHAQTTSLHAVAALLSAPSSALREACARTRNGVYSGRVQFKALELSLGVAMDRVPTEGRRRGVREGEEPPVSNSFMAAIRRAQANQRRQPECFQLYQQQQSSSVSMVKVELQNLILSILDDPVVSRVLGEAGFRSCDIKLSILRPLHQLLRYSHYRGPPMFLCNLTDGNFRRIGDVLTRRKWRNPLLIGTCANEALHSFCENLDRKKGGYLLPMEIMDFNVLHMGSEISSFLREGCSEDVVKMRFREVALMVEQCSGPGLVISYGDVEELTNEVSSCIISELTNLLNLSCPKVWLIGASESYETFLKFSNRFPFVVKDWDLQLLPITSLKPSSEEPIPKSSLMESFVPFGGFFPSSSDLTSSFVGLNQYPTRCRLCNEKCEQEIYAISKRGITDSVIEQLSPSAPSRLQMNEWSTTSRLEIVKTDECTAMNTKVKMLQMKWDNICQHLHHTSQSTREDFYSSSSRVSTDNPQSGISTEMVTKFLPQKNGKIFKKSYHIDLNELSPLPLSNSSSEDRFPSPCSSTNVSNFDHGDFKKLYNLLNQTMSWQEEAISAVTQTIARCKMRNQKHFGTSIRGDIWISFLGPDNFSKKRIAIALVEILYGSRGNFIHVDLNFHDRDSIKFRGKNVIDYLAWELSKKPFSVVFLENIEKADLVVQNSLSQAIRTGKFPDLYGREIGVCNTMFVLTSKVCLADESSNFFEESILRAKRKPLQMIINFGNDPNPIIFSKRKSMGVSEIVKRAHKDPNLDLDLNLLPKDIELHYEENSKVWFENFLDLVDETVIFKPFDFEKFTEKITKEIDECFQSIMGSDCALEVDSVAMEPILTYAYLSEGNEIQNWVKKVLSRGFIDAQKNPNFTSSSILKLTSREGIDPVEKTSGFHLPSSILVE